MLTSRSFFYSDSTPSTLPGMMSPFAEISSSAPQTSPLKFKPLPSNSATCSKLKLNILLDSTIFVAGGEICGRLVIESKTDTDLLLGEIAVELNGFECIEDSDVTASCQSFLSARIMFQGDRLPPSNICVRGQSENGFRLANKGKTVFPFAFRIPSDAPSSYYFLKLASLRYVVTGVCMFQYNGKSTDTMFKSTDANVVESWKDSPPPPPLPARAEGEKKTLFFGSAGLVHLDCVLEKSLYTSGSEVYIQVNVKNNSKNRLQGVKIKLNQKLVTFKDSSNTLHIVNDVVSQVSFNTTSFCYDPKEERSSMLHIQIPSTLKSIRNTALAEVLCSVTVSMSLGLFSKDLSVELPIIVCNSASIQPPRQIDASSFNHPQIYNTQDARVDVSSIKLKNEVKSSSINQTQAAKKSTLRVLPWSDHVESEVIESGQIKNPPNCVNVVNIDPEVSQNPLHYIPAPQRSLRMVKSMASIYCDLSMIGQNDYSFLNQPALDFSLGEIESEGKVVSKKVTLHDKTIDVNLFLKNDKPRNPLKEMERIDQSLILK